ncbi:MAG: DUF2911 domain-containing protein [Terriglobia bacterium]
MRASKSLLTLSLALLMAAALPAWAQRGNDEARPSPNAEVSQTIGTTEVTVSYGRPGVKDRAVWGGLVPNGQVWRTGANEATTISFSSDVAVEGQPLAAGTYGLFTTPGAGEWTVIFNKTANQWGAFRYDAGQDALRVTVKPRSAAHREWMSFGFADLSAGSATLVLRWEKLAVPIKIALAE